MTRRGYGFVTTPEGDFFIPGKAIGGAFHGDTVEVIPDAVRTGRGRSGSITRVLERARSSVVGYYERSGSLGVVIPTDTRIRHDIFVSARDTEATTGDIVLARITEYPTRETSAQGYVEEILGRHDDPDIGVEIIIREHGLETTFSDAALEEAESIKVDIDYALRDPYRRDIRDRLTFTIDPEDARDFDDAISIERIEGRLRLGVHIADVSHYVPWDSSIDTDARRRATSVYLVDRVLPMLPEKLSNEVCSLVPGEDRVTFTVDMWVDKDGGVEVDALYGSVIRSDRRFDYEEVQRMIDGDLPFPSRDLELALRDFAATAERLSKRRTARGALDFETVEAKVRLSEVGEPLEIVLRKRTEATSMIEEAMIAANEAVARHMAEVEAPMIYRIHEAPDAEALASLSDILAEFDYPVKDLSNPTPSQFQKIIAYADGRPEKYLINSLVLRVMERARYVDRLDTHFGLASTAYTHFTSPIRRYPDLIAHRLLRAQLAGDLERDPGIVSMVSELGWLAEHSSSMEREADRASWDSTMLKICEYMEDRIGDRYGGYITGVVQYGFFVRLDNTAEGLVHTDTLKERCEFEPARHVLTGLDTGRRFRLGQRVDVIVESVFPRERRIDFRLAQ